MNRETVEKWILLEDAGELGAIRRWRLRRALARQPDLQAWRKEVADLGDWSRRAAAPVPNTPRDVMAAILLAGRQEHAPTAHAPWVFNPAWACAAVLMLGLAAWLTLVRPSSTPMALGSTSANPSAVLSLAWEDGLDNQIADLYAQLDDVQESWIDSSSTADELDAMASELLGEGTSI